MKTTVFIAILLVLIVIGAFLNPELSSYALGLIALIAIFSIVLHHLEDRLSRTEKDQSLEREDTLLFLTTKIKPKLEEVVETNPLPVLKNLLHMIEDFVSRK